ncbi:MAG: discoidin domain-containing protein [Thermochromatium sp.]
MHLLDLDDFSDLSVWSGIASGQARLDLVPDTGPEDTGCSMRLDFDFGAGGGFVVARRAMRLTLPDSFAFRLWVRAAAPANAFEFKLVDPSGENVWRLRDESFDFASPWREMRIGSRAIAFGWGPAGGGAPTEVGAIEIAITAGPGGKGSLWVAGLRLEDRTPSQPPVIRVSSQRPGQGVDCLLDGRSDTAWRPERLPAWVELDFTEPRDYSALILHWDSPKPRTFEILASDTGTDWSRLQAVSGARGRCHTVYLPGGSSRLLRVVLVGGEGDPVPGLVGLEPKPETFARSIEEFVQRLAEQTPYGWYPRWLYREQTYWTPIDIPDGTVPALFNEEGQIEVWRAGPLIEPLLSVRGTVLTWAEGSIELSLLQSPLPIPRSTWNAEGLVFDIMAFAHGEPGRAWLFIRYRLDNPGAEPLPAQLYVAIRPFQVSPPWQRHKDIGGMARIERIAWEQGEVWINGRLALVPLSTPDGFGAMTLDEGSIVEAIATDTLPEIESVAQAEGRATAALRFALDVEPGGRREVWLAAPLGAHQDAHPRPSAADSGAIEAALDSVLEQWSQRLGGVALELPEVARDHWHGCQGALAHLLINRNGPALQPGPRRYARSWIRDGAIMAAALLRFGLRHEAESFIDWYAQFQDADGRIPCCVDREGVDPLVEHDSQGQFIFAVADAWRFGMDRARLEALWPAVCRAVGQLEQLRAQCPTPEYQAPEGCAYRGLLLESVSHEGYLAHPVHSYWDDFWALRGFKDAAILAEALGDAERAAHFAQLRDAFAADLLRSLDRVMAERGLEFLPGSVEWADLDPTATAMALTLIDESHRLPAAALHRTFDLFMQRFRAIHGPNPVPWTNYTAYEIRIAGALLRLGRRAEAHELLRVYLTERRPAVWHQWPEITWRDPRAPGHQGDLPHAWIGAEYCLVFRDLFVYEREADGSLVVGAGLPPEWLAAGEIHAHRLPTAYGLLDLDIACCDGGAVRLRVGGALRTPPGGLWVAPPLPGPLVSLELDGQPSRDFNATAAHVTTLPATLTLVG